MNEFSRTTDERTDSPPTFTTTCAENIQSLVVSGEIDVRSRADFAACVDDLIGERHPFVLDCSDVQFISVGGLSIIETLSAKHGGSACRGRSSQRTLSGVRCLF